MEHCSNSLVANKIWLLTNNLPETDIDEVDNSLSNKLFLENLSLKRKNNRLNKLNNQINNSNRLQEGSNTVEFAPRTELHPLDADTDKYDKSNDPEKSDFHTEQIDSPSTSKNLDNIERDSEEWDEFSHREPKKTKPKKKKSSKRKVVLVASNKKKSSGLGSVIKGGLKVPKLHHLNNRQGNYLAVGPKNKQNQSNRKSRLFSQNRQLTSKTDDIYTREGGEYIRKITQRTNTKYSNFSEFPNPIKERQVKLNQLKEDPSSKFRSRTVKRKNKGASKLGIKKVTPRRNKNIITDLQRKTKYSPQKLCCDFWNSEIVRSNVEPSDASHLAISKFGRTNTGSVISEESSSKNGKSKIKAKNAVSLGKKFHSKNIYQNSRYTKTDATRTDTKSWKQTYSREPSLSSNRSNAGFYGKKPSLPRHANSRSRSSKYVSFYREVRSRRNSIRRLVLLKHRFHQL